MEGRTRAYRRHHRRRVIRHKRTLLTEIYGSRKNGYEEFPVDGKLAKGKIHCSCSMCSVKVKTNGYKHSDRKQLVRANDVPDWEGVKIHYI